MIHKRLSALLGSLIRMLERSQCEDLYLIGRAVREGLPMGPAERLAILKFEIKQSLIDTLNWVGSRISKGVAL